MERLTFEGNFCDIARCGYQTCPYKDGCSQKQVWERLKAYEDTGLTPEEIKAPFTEDAMINLAAQALGVEPSRRVRGTVRDGQRNVTPSVRRIWPTRKQNRRNIGRIRLKETGTPTLRMRKSGVRAWSG